MIKRVNKEYTKLINSIEINKRRGKGEKCKVCS